LRDGDRLTIGQYIIAVALDGEEIAARPTPVAPVSYHELWRGTEDAAPPVDPKLLRPAAQHAPLRPDFLHWAVDVPETRDPDHPPASPSPAARAAPADDDLWAHGAARPAPAPEPPPAMPAPRRPVWVSTEPSGAWAAPVPPSVTAEDAAAREALRAPTWTDAPSEIPAHASPPRSGLPDFVRLFAQGANLSPGALARDPAQLAEELGRLVRLVTENLQQLLNARLQAKRIARVSNQTSIEALNNNPLKFSPSSDDALRIMFGPPTTSYLDARHALEEAFGDLKEHQLRSYSAMQQAIAMMVADLDPQAIDDATEADRGISGVIGSRKARLWDAYVARWQAITRGRSDGLVDVFMQYFAEQYDGGDTRRR
jgi:type VI secretion system protein ImpI